MQKTHGHTETNVCNAIVTWTNYYIYSSYYESLTLIAFSMILKALKQRSFLLPAPWETSSWACSSSFITSAACDRKMDSGFTTFDISVSRLIAPARNDINKTKQNKERDKNQLTYRKILLISPNSGFTDLVQKQRGANNTGILSIKPIKKARSRRIDNYTTVSHSDRSGITQNVNG